MKCVVPVVLCILMGIRERDGNAADRPHRQDLSRRDFYIIRHTGTDGIREYRRQYSLFESQRGYVIILKLLLGGNNA